jgi:ribonuclease E
MSKEIYISTTPHETRLAIVEDEQLAEIYYERENEYSLAGSIYNGKVTRVLPGMQSSFVDIGLERDAFLYVTDFMEEAGDSADFESADGGRKQGKPREATSEASAEPREAREPRPEGRGDREGGRGRGRRDRGARDGDRGERRPAVVPAAETESTTSFDEPIAPSPTEDIGTVDAAGEDRGGSRRWRGRRGRRRGRTGRDEQPSGSPLAEASPQGDDETVIVEGGYAGDFEAADTAIEIDLSAEPAAPQNAPQRTREDRGGRGRGGRDRGRGGRDRDSRPARSESVPEAPAFDNSYAGYYDETALPEPTGEPILLPGESIRKYRDPAEVAAEDEEARRNAPPAPEVLTISAPTIEVVGWDGGAVLPGESLGRHRNRPQSAPKPAAPIAARVPAPVVASSVEAAPEPVETAPEPVIEPTPVEVAADPVETVEEAAAVADLGALPGDLPLVSEAEAAEVAEVSALEEVSAPEEVAAVAEPVEPAEYEPIEGEGAVTSDNARRPFRWFGKAKPEPAPEPEEVAAPTPDPTTYDLNTEPLEAEFTTLQASGEMLSIPAEPEGTPTPLAAQDEPAPANPIAQESAVQSVTLAEAVTPPQPAATFGDATEEEFTDENVQPEIHAYGDGDFHEEEIDEAEGEAYVYEAAVAGDEGEPEEYEEETLEGSTDLGSMLHEMTLDSHAGDEDSEDDEETDASGGFTEADFGDESEEGEEPAEGAASTGEPRPRGDRNDRARRSGGGGGNRDRRGGRNSGGDRGRGRGGRPSVQASDLPAINDLLKPGQEILVQIAKEPIAKKGARITSHIALPGRFLVFMPTVNHTGVSRKISSDEERRRLKSILLSEKGDATGGFIVRTAADGASEEELRNDLRFLIHLWNDIKMRSESSKSPALIYHDLSLVERILRDQVGDNFSAIWVDTESEYERVLRFLQRFQPSLVRRVKLYTKETPLFEHFGVTQEIDKALKAKVWLKSGGSIVINQTEALVAIDINTGKYVGKTARLEDTILKTNLDSIPEIVRQIRLRDLGGIIVIDFIDMDERKNRAKVLQALEDEMRNDRAPSKILPFNDFGLVIMTRKRVKQSLERTLCIPDPVTEGTGMIKSPITVANEIFIEMRKMHRHLEKGDVMLRVHPEVVKTLKANGGKRLQELEEMTHKTILVKSDAALNPEQFDIH